VVVRKPRRGYTLFESIVVVAILAIVAAAVAPTIQSMYGDTPVTAASDTVKARWADAKARAASENRPYKFAVIENSGRFKIAPDSPEFWDGAGGDSGTNGLVMEDKLPRDVVFCAPGAAPAGAGAGNAAGQDQGVGGDWSSSIVFNPDGSADRDAEIAFGEAGARPVVLKLRGATGVVTTAPR